MKIDYLLSGSAVELQEAEELALMGKKGALQDEALFALLPEGAAPVWKSMVDSLQPGDRFHGTHTWLETSRGPKKLHALAISEEASRHNSKSRPDAQAEALKGLFAKESAALLVLLEDEDELESAVLAIARAHSLLSYKANAKEQSLKVAFYHNGALIKDEEKLKRAGLLSESIRYAASLLDMPPMELDCDRFVKEATEWAADEKEVTVKVLRQKELEEKGMGGLLAVGKGAEREPALVHLSYRPSGASLEPMAWVGKGIVYDTGGLSLKPKTAMVGMKSDMGGAAAVLGAFQMLVRSQSQRPVDAILCIAENAVGKGAYRPDDIIKLYSGKRIEINNTDAEGRLVLSDGVAYAARDLGAKLVFDLATLTGAQLVSTGRLHAGIVSNEDALEAAAIQAGRASGDLVFPLPFAPELYRKEFASPIADLKNSVKDRANAQSSCAAQFVAESLFASAADPKRLRWLHVDLAGPSVASERGTGFGVALLLALSEDKAL